jgi:hypothetical protein
MNPCPKNRKPIAWMASGDLEPRDAETLRRHFEHCPGCRQYARDMVEITRRLKNAGLPAAEASETFHQKLVRGISHPQARPKLSVWAAVVQHFQAHRGLGITAAAAVLALAAFWLRHPPQGHEDAVPPRGSFAVITVDVPMADASTRLATYRRAAEISLEHLDALLTRQVARGSARGETFTVSSWGRGPGRN